MNPKAFDQIQGQEKAIRFITGCLSRRHLDALNRCYLLSGPPGIGKTSIAKAIGDYLEIDHIESINSGDQLAERVREVLSGLDGYSLLGNGERLVIINEVDKMTDVSENLWLDGLENVPPHAIVVMTTNYPEKVSQRLIDRTKHVKLSQPSHAELQAYVDAACLRLGKPSFPIPIDLTNYRRAKSITDDYGVGAWEPTAENQSSAGKIEDNLTVLNDIPERAKRLKKQPTFMLNYMLKTLKKQHFLSISQKKIALRELEKLEN